MVDVDAGDDGADEVAEDFEGFLAEFVFGGGVEIGGGGADEFDEDDADFDFGEEFEDAEVVLVIVAISSAAGFGAVSTSAAAIDSAARRLQSVPQIAQHPHHDAENVQNLLFVPRRLRSIHVEQFHARQEGVQTHVGILVMEEGIGLDEESGEGGEAGGVGGVQFGVALQGVGYGREAAYYVFLALGILQIGSRQNGHALLLRGTPRFAAGRSAHGVMCAMITSFLRLRLSRVVVVVDDKENTSRSALKGDEN
mmetsp:Transcript_17683/g.36041  ORF Transcript_17683/g.36041 Transcript_17683/m.36041 type:complete len:253 (-) Transcript_17683:171-929(-)